MGEILGLGISHYPGFAYSDRTMGARLTQTLTSPRVPNELKNPANWSETMRTEWGDDEGATFAAQHRMEFRDGARKVRAALDEFAPDAVVIFGDDQYENFKEDIVPPFAVSLAPEFRDKPFVHGRPGIADTNVWDLPRDHEFVFAGHPRIGADLVSGLIDEGFDIPYSYRQHHIDGLSHAFMYTLLYLDYERTGWPYPIVPFAVNAYGSSVIRSKGSNAHLFEDMPANFDPPAPMPWRCFDLGRAIARFAQSSDYKIALVGSSSWSHAFLTAKNSYLYPDIEADRLRFQQLRDGESEKWRSLTHAELQASGQHELLNWIPLAGAMTELGRATPSYAQLLESYTMNSSKCFAVFSPS